MTYTVHHRGCQVVFERFGGPSVERALAAGRFYEADMLEYVEALQLGGSYVDVGAYAGTHAIFFALFCPVTRVHAFEPVAEFHDALTRNLAANPDAVSVEVHRIGLSDVDETTETELLGKRSTIECRRLDELIDEPVSLIKIDVEGMELSVLRGAEELIRRHSPLLFFEAHTAVQLEGCMAYLAPLGYHLTGRVFNASPTYEVAADLSRLPRERPLLSPELWRFPSSPHVRLAWDGPALTAATDFPSDKFLHVTHDDSSFEVAPRQDALTASPGTTIFVQVSGEITGSAACSVHLFQYGRGRAPIKQSLGSLPRVFRRIPIDPSTTALRLVLRLSGRGAVRVQRIALHQAAA